MSVKESIRSVIRHMLFVPEQPRAWYSVLVWWEMRRFVYNAVMLVTGLTGLALFLMIDELPPQLPFEQRDWEPLSVLIFGILANMAYTLGWIVELAVRGSLGKLAHRFAPLAFTAGTLFSMAVCFVPALLNGLFWIFRVLSRAKG